DTVTLTLRDGDETLPGVATATLAVRVVSVNDAPVLTAPSRVALVREGADHVLYACEGLDVADVDAGAGALTVSIQAGGGGRVSLDRRVELAFEEGTGEADARMRFRGQLQHVSLALRSFRYHAALPRTGRDEVVVRVTDNGAPSLSDEAVVTVQLRHVNKAPVVPGGQVREVEENSPAGTLVGVQVFAWDPDAGEVMTFSIVGGDGEHKFTIHPAT
ncbi:MAG: hypothetical protein ACK41Y_16495, partial [Paracoccus hibiscisoli]|uniref:cadherin repeat domain-containing protein n=1 Tax=Paracoccus hibiscisoli TaxID=2023261 RepID=UPI00391949CD